MSNAKYLVKEREHDGFSRNPYRRGGTITRWTKRKTVARCDTLDEAKKVRTSRLTGVSRREVWFRGKMLIGSDGRERA